MTTFEFLDSKLTALDARAAELDAERAVLRKLIRELTGLPADAPANPFARVPVPASAPEVAAPAKAIPAAPAKPGDPAGQLLVALLAAPGQSSTALADRTGLPTGQAALYHLKKYPAWFALTGTRATAKWSLTPAGEAEARKRSGGTIPQAAEPAKAPLPPAASVPEPKPRVLERRKIVARFLRDSGPKPFVDIAKGTGVVACPLEDALACDWFSKNGGEYDLTAAGLAGIGAGREAS
jgi:hypothetical protein